MAIISTAPDLPTRFPCWCRAVYSWGGETDKDLGFIEGDLIECLNAGDGSWWMGRLRRDKRMIGLFPSNFVIVLDNGFQPVSRSTSPMPGPPSRCSSPSPQKQKSSSRKPFSGYKSANSPVSTPTKAMEKPPTIMHHAGYDQGHPPSTVLWNLESNSRAISRSPSPMEHHDIGSSPPPPPPPHRVAPGSLRRHTPSPHPMDADVQYDILSRTPSPRPASHNGHTPPMLRSAMDDVMSSLEDMGMSRRDEPVEQRVPFNPWSPDAFEELRKPVSQRPDVRPLTSLGLGAGGSNYSDRQNYSSQHNSPDRYQDGPPQLSNYVQRMENRLRQMQEQQNGNASEFGESHAPEPPPKNSPWNSRPVSAMLSRRMSLKARKSAYELGRDVLGRTFTTKSSATNSSSGIQSNATLSSTQTSMTSQSLMSGQSAGAFSATSAGSLARRAKIGGINPDRPVTSSGIRSFELRPQTPLTGFSIPSSHDSRQGAQSALGWESRNVLGESTTGLGGLSPPKVKKQGFFKKLIEGAKTGAASARSTVNQGSTSPTRGVFNNGVTSIAGGTAIRRPGEGRDAGREMGLGGGNIDWVKIRRDLNRSNTPGPTERQDRVDRCLMLDYPVICPVDEVFETAEGNESMDGLPVPDPFQLNNPSFTGVDKAARFITSLPPMTNAASLAQGYVCRPHRSNVQRLRAIFTWVSERLGWDEDFDGDIDTRRVIQSKRGCSHELAALVVEMCDAIGIHAEVVRGYLKTPGEDMDLDALKRPNHYWNAILVDNEWRMMDCCLASPTNPKRSLYSSISSSIAEPFYFLTKPLESCYTHVPLNPAQQHIVPPISPDVLLSLPCALPPYFRQNLTLHAYDTSLIRLEALELCTLFVNVPVDVEIAAEVTTQSYLRDPDGDVYENGDKLTHTPALTQVSWYAPGSNPNILQKRYVVKAVLPPDAGTGILKVYAGKRGLMHSSKDIPHPLAMALPLYHQGENPAYNFLRRHPTPHAMRQDLYVVQPQCLRLGMGELYVFSVRQHAASVVATPVIEQNGFDFGPASPGSTSMGAGIGRPASALSMTSSANGSGGGGSDQGSTVGVIGVKVKDKPAKLAVQSPGGKIIRLSRKAESSLPSSGRSTNPTDGEVQGSIWEVSVKVHERGTWRGLVLADRSARWCVWGEWECE